ncbi:hypothetical protein DFH08DRAFT_822751 [Mycena albidolilacea]|uniref:Uncharacterized protein n=1 Tax=Mycena albidolilacea TaxID=1033008 RepID=A0AAD6Z7F7_9AGAR|nr:hypothetical protein DFH08DRAFT_822751 [Mycena albidolilacea]
MEVFDEGRDRLKRPSERRKPEKGRGCRSADEDENGGRDGGGQKSACAAGAAPTFMDGSTRRRCICIPCRLGLERKAGEALTAMSLSIERDVDARKRPAMSAGVGSGIGRAQDVLSPSWSGDGGGACGYNLRGRRDKYELRGWKEEEGRKSRASSSSGPSIHPFFLHVTARTSGMSSIDKMPAGRIHLETHPGRNTGNSASLCGDEDTKTHAGLSVARAGSWRTRDSRRAMWASALWCGECISINAKIRTRRDPDARTGCEGLERGLANGRHGTHVAAVEYVSRCTERLRKDRAKKGIKPRFAIARRHRGARKSRRCQEVKLVKITIAKEKMTRPTPQAYKVPVKAAKPGDIVDAVSIWAGIDCIGFQ